VPGVVFDPARVDKVIAALRCLRHTQGKWAGRPLEPDAWQVAYIIAPVFGWVHKEDDRWVRVIRSAYVELSRKGGKGLDVDENILTERGWVRFGDLAAGDRVHALDGSLTEVTYVSPVHHLDCYRVTFEDGRSVVCDSQHLWSVFDRRGYGGRDHSVKGRRAYVTGTWKTVDTPTLAAQFDISKPGATNLVNGRRYAKREFRFAVRADRQLDRPDADLPIDPYLLGLWLGDGTTTAAAITTPDPEVPDAFAAAGYTVRRIGGTPYTYGISGGLRRQLREAGLLGDKHVPEAYLLASADQRLALLQGLMDADGFGDPKRVEFCTTRAGLAEAVLFLARSLGWKASLAEGRATLYGKDCGPKYRVCWTAFRERSPFRLKRKTDRLRGRPATAVRSETVKIVDVERVASRPTRCIQVAHPSAQFLVGRGLIPTHNTTLLSGLLLVLAFADGEQGAQVLAVAGSEKQARHCFDPAAQLARSSPQLKAAGIRALNSRIVQQATGSYFAVAASVGDLLHGANVHAAGIDELHVHKTADVVDAVESGTGARAQPLVITITTADDGKPNSVYAHKRDYIERLARGSVKQPSVYGVVFAADADDDPFAESTWMKANPGYGVSPTRAFLADEAAKAQQNPVNLARFKRLHLGLRTKQETKFFELSTWDRNAGLVDEAKLVARNTYGGLDLASTSDLTALCWLFPDGVGGYDALWRLWTPEANMQRLNDRTAGGARLWARQGYLRTTPGEVTDYGLVRRQIVKDMSKFRVVELAYDPWNASQLVTDLQGDGAPMVTVRQGYASLSPPMKQVSRLLLEGTPERPLLRHGGNPAMRWMVDNVAVAMDPSGNVKPDRARSADKIDGVAALVTAMARAMVAGKPKRSAYDDERGLEVV
jgi:phage terminase large subunit-like protein